MPDSEREKAGPLSLDEWIAFNDEIVVLARSGLPLERGLVEAGSELSGRLGRLARVLGDRLSRGESLVEALSAEQASVPRLYRSVVEAGVRAGRLPAALEGLAAYARGYAESRRVIGLALWYPLIVLVLAFSLFLLLIIRILPVFVATFTSLRVPMQASLLVLSRLGAQAGYWAPIVPVLLVLAAVWWVRSGRSTSLRAGGAGSPLRWFPWVGRMLDQFEAANFAELLALLLDHRVPFPEAVALSAEATENPALIRSCRALAAEVERGSRTSMAQQGQNGLPPLLRWVLASGERQGDVVGALRQLARLYRRRAQFQAETSRALLPTVMLIAVGGLTTLLYGLTLFVPLSTLLRQLAAGVG